MSPPVRRRGLKHATVQPKSATGLVASRAEAWIETNEDDAKEAEGMVASRAEAWIETTSAVVALRPMPCRLPCGGVD